MQIFAGLALPGFGVDGEQALQFADEVVVHAEMAEMAVALGFGFGLPGFHFCGRSGGSYRPQSRRISRLHAHKAAKVVVVTVLVPAPDDPVMAMMGWRSDMMDEPR